MPHLLAVLEIIPETERRHFVLMSLTFKSFQSESRQHRAEKKKKSINCNVKVSFKVKSLTKTPN